MARRIAWTLLWFSLVWALVGAMPGASRLLSPGGAPSGPVESKARLLSRRTNHSAYLLNFLGNLRRFSSQELRALEHAGLVHLLAISGAQMADATRLAARAASGFLGLRSAHALQWVLYAWFGLAYGVSGALLRVGFLRVLGRAPWIRQGALGCAWYLPIPPSAWIRGGMVLALSALFGPVFSSPSFLLSALGACVAHRTSGRMPLGAFPRRLAPAARACGHTAATTCVLGILLAPVSSHGLFAAIAANLLAIPLVGFVVTPLSVAAILAPLPLAKAVLVPPLEVSLALLRGIAWGFAQESPGTWTVFSVQGQRYLGALLVVLWTLDALWWGGPKTRAPRASPEPVRRSPQCPVSRLT